MKKFVLTCGLVAGSASAFNLRRTSSLRSEPAGEEGAEAARAEPAEEKPSCGSLKLPPHAKAANYADSKTEHYSTDDKMMVPVLFYSGDKVPLKCEKGFTLTGANDGPVEFETECSEAGYYKPTAACQEASKCGALPEFPNALPSGKVEKRVGMPVRTEFTCAAGFSLDGEKVVEGGLGKNSLFTIDCEPDGTFKVDEKLKKGCQASSFVGSTEIIDTYSQVFKVLFEVTCKNHMLGHHEMPADLKSICSKNFGDDAAAAAECDGLISKAESEIIAKNKEDDETVKESDSLDSNQFKERDASAKDFCKALSDLHWKAAPADAAGAPPTEF